MEKIKSYKCTCYAMPVQYDIFLENGDYLYFRYRFGSLSITRNKDVKTWFENGKCIYYWQSDDEWGGDMEEKEVFEHLKKAGFEL